jgi:hypothetical protein
MSLLIRETRLLFLAAHGVEDRNPAAREVAKRALNELAEKSGNAAIIREARRLMAYVP